MSLGWDTEAAIRQLCTDLPAALERPRIVVVPLVVGSSDMTSEEAARLVAYLKKAFEEVFE